MIKKNITRCFAIAAAVLGMAAVPMKSEAVIVRGFQQKDCLNAVNAGDKAAPIMRAYVKMEDTDILEGSKLLGATIELKGNTINNIEKVYFHSGTVTAVGNVLAEVVPTTNEVTFTLAEPLDLVSGTQQFWFTVDVKSNATLGDEIDVLLKSFTLLIDDFEDPYLPDEGTADPDGGRLIVYQYLMKNGDNGEIVVPADMTLSFFDDGGSNNDAKKKFVSTATFVPEKEGYAVKFVVNYVSMNKYTKFYIYNGGEVNDANLIETYETEESDDVRFTNEGIVSTSADGKLTVKFDGSQAEDSWLTCDGWDISVSLVDATTVGIQNVGMSESKTSIFTLDGRRQQTLRKGINIIRTEDGKTQKLLVK